MLKVIIRQRLYIFGGYLANIAGHGAGTTAYYANRKPDDRKIDFLQDVLHWPMIRPTIIHALKDIDVRGIYFLSSINRAIVLYFDACNQFCGAIYKLDQPGSLGKVISIFAV